MGKIDLLDKVIYSIDYEEERIEQKMPSYDLTAFIDQLAEDTTMSNKSQMYMIRDENTQVISLATKIIIEWNRSGDEEKRCLAYARSIALRLLDKEINVQDRIERSGKNVKKGSLLQAVLYNKELNEYEYLLTKIEHKDFFESNEYKKLSGFSADKNKFFKSCLMTFHPIINDKVEIKQICVFLDNKAEYWCDDFLEINPVRQDDRNTMLMFQNIDKQLKTIVYPKSRREYQTYRNHLLGYIRSHERIHYDDMIDEIFVKPEEVELQEQDKSKLLERLKELPEEKSFDREFNSMPSLIKAGKINRQFDLNQGVRLVITDYIPEEMKCISVDKDEDGLKYIKIQTNDIEAINTFERK